MYARDKWMETDTEETPIPSLNEGLSFEYSGHFTVLLVKYKKCIERANY